MQNPENPKSQAGSRREYYQSKYPPKSRRVAPSSVEGSIPVIDGGEPIVVDTVRPDKYEGNMGDLVTLGSGNSGNKPEFNWITKIQMELQQLKVLDDPQAKENLLEIFREKLQGWADLARAENDTLAMEMLLEQLANAEEFMLRLGILGKGKLEISTILQNGLNDIVKADPAKYPNGLNLFTPEGFKVAIQVVFPEKIMASILSAPTIASEIAEIEVAAAVGRRGNELALIGAEKKQELDLAKIRNGKDVEIIKIQADGDVAREVVRHETISIQAAETEQRIAAVESRKRATEIAAAIRGYSGLPVAIPEGFTEELKLWLKKNPFTCVGVVVGVAGGISLPLIAATTQGEAWTIALGLSIAGLGIQAIYEKVLENRNR